MDTVKNKLSSCFNPIVAKDEQQFHSTPFSDAGEIRRRKKPVHYSLSGFVKAVFLLKKLRTKRSKRDSYRSSNNTSPSKIKKPTKNKKTQTRNKSISDPDELFRNRSDHSSLFSSTSSSSIASSIYSNSSSDSDRIKLALSDFPDSSQASSTSTNNFRQHAMKLVSKSSKCDCSGLMFIILVCLVALVFWGKVFAIVTCSSAWLFLAPGRAGNRGGRIGPVVYEGLEEHKKRVIMEGLLERNNTIRSRVVQ
ncbi:hypothetical protein CASFOL_041816 [Castilleja foliolosa]|uniref:Transmembrane protein n=1 Tax=Castilleja foliolosa TaxID=1961234 RepID=A0ABD3BA00_9LAMI